MTVKGITSYTDLLGRILTDLRTPGQDLTATLPISNSSQEITPEKFKETLLKICTKETSSSPDTWSTENPLLGHCAVVTLLAQDLFGGEILRGSLDNTPFAYMRSHYWNKLPDGTEIDFTKDQFQSNSPQNLKSEPRTREYLLSNAETLKRYTLLKALFDAEIGLTQTTTPAQSTTTENPGDVAAKLREATSFKRNDSRLFTLPEKYNYEVFEGDGKLDSKGNVVALVVGPFGGGKNSLVDSTTKVANNIVQQVVEHTSRERRPHETEGKEYFFVTTDEFRRMTENNEILVWGDLTGNFYGYSTGAIQSALNSGKVPVLVQGPNNVGPIKNALEKRNIPTVTAFVSPLSKEELNQDGGIDKAIEILEKRMEGTARNRLKERSEISRAMFESLPDGISVIDNSTGRLEQATIDFLSLIQAKKEEVSKLKPTKHPAMIELEETGKIGDDFFNRHKIDPKGRKAIIISGPSGAGKGTVLEQAFNDKELNLGKAISYTSRTKRPNETDGVDYFFITPEEFKDKIQNGDMFEWLMVVNSKYYGHSEKQIQNIFDEGKDAIFDVDIKGANYYRHMFKRMGVPYVDVFISPVSKEILDSPNYIEESRPILESRIRNRGSGETEAQIQDRLNHAKEYLKAAGTFTHIIENTDKTPDRAISEFIAIAKGK